MRASRTSAWGPATRRCWSPTSRAGSLTGCTRRQAATTCASSCAGTCAAARACTWPARARPPPGARYEMRLGAARPRPRTAPPGVVEGAALRVCGRRCSGRLWCGCWAAAQCCCGRVLPVAGAAVLDSAPQCRASQPALPSLACLCVMACIKVLGRIQVCKCPLLHQCGQCPLSAHQRAAGRWGQIASSTPAPVQTAVPARAPHVRHGAGWL